jgi:hypothetical protein
MPDAMSALSRASDGLGRPETRRAGLAGQDGDTGPGRFVSEMRFGWWRLALDDVVE